MPGGIQKSSFVYPDFTLDAGNKRIFVTAIKSHARLLLGFPQISLIFLWIHKIFISLENKSLKPLNTIE